MWDQSLLVDCIVLYGAVQALIKTAYWRWLCITKQVHVLNPLHCWNSFRSYCAMLILQIPNATCLRGAFHSVKACAADSCISLTSPVDSFKFSFNVRDVTSRQLQFFVVTRDPIDNATYTSAATHFDVLSLNRSEGESLYACAIKFQFMNLLATCTWRILCLFRVESGKNNGWSWSNGMALNACCSTVCFVFLLTASYS